MYIGVLEILRQGYSYEKGIRYKRTTSIATSLLWMLPHNLIDFVDLNYN